MKKLLIASTALSLAGGAAFAEMAVTVGGSAELGLDYNSEPGEGMSKHKFVHDFGVTFAGSGTTDGGLSFSASAGFDNKTGGGSFDDGSVSVSGSFGTLSIGDVARGINLAGDINDVGMNDIGVDDMVEDLREGTAKQIRYGNTFGQISIAISAGTKDGSAAVAPIPEVTREVPEITVPGSKADEWYLIDFDNVVHAYDMTPNAGTINSVFGIVRTPTSGTDLTPTAVTQDHNNDGTGTSIFEHGYQTNDDDEFVLDGEGNKIVVVDAAADPDDQTPAGTDAIAAFNNYVKIYDLGEDGAVGGGDDVQKMVTGDNEVQDTVIPAGTFDDILISAAVPGKDAVKSETQYAFGMNFDAGGVTIGVGYDSEKTVSMGASFSAGEVSTNLLYVKTDDDTTGIGADMKYTMGASAVTLAYGRTKPKEGEAMDAVGMGVTHDLGGGAELNAGFGKVNEANKASIGIKFAF